MMSSFPQERPTLAARQIRLVQFHRSKADQSLKCPFTIANLDEIKFPYYAISYVWGDPTIVAHIECTQGSSDLPLTAATYKIVEWFEKSVDPGMYCWVDSLCIDQGNAREKSEQVALMATVYHSARRVIAWLGFMEDGNLAMSCIAELHNYFVRCQRADIQPTPQTIVELPGWSRGSPKWKAIDSLFECSFFGRVWIVQELVVAPERHDPELAGLDPGIMLHCNDISIPWEVFASAIHGLYYGLGWGLKLLLAYNFDLFPPPALTAALTIANLRRVRLHDETITLDTALACCREFKATLGHDKVYAVMNVVQHDPIVDKLGPDYASPIDTVFTNTTVALLGQAGTLRALQHAGIGWPHRLPGLPSWVTDWSSDDNLASFGIDRVFDEAHYCASANAHASLSIDLQERSLAVEMIYVDKVGSIIGAPTGHSPDELLPNIIRFAEEAYTFACTSSCYSGLQEATMVSLLSADQMRDPDPGLFQSWLYQVRNNDELDGVGNEFHRALGVARSGGKILFGTEEYGFLGYGPPGTQAGDALCILAGATTSFVLRPGNGHGKQHWRLVGECYAQGLMHGEGLEMGERQSCVII